MTKETRPSSYPLRLPIELREMLEQSAKENGRPLSSEIIMRLNESFEISKAYQKVKKERDDIDKRLEANADQLEVLNAKVNELSELFEGLSLDQKNLTK